MEKRLTYNRQKNSLSVCVIPKKQNRVQERICVGEKRKHAKLLIISQEKKTLIFKDLYTSNIFFMLKNKSKRPKKKKKFINFTAIVKKP